MKIVEIKNAESRQNPHGVDARIISDNKNAQAVHIALKPGEALKKHITPVDVFFYILEGEITVEVGDERSVVGPDTLVESPAKIPHCLINQGNGLGRVLVVKTPKPSDATKML
jgi:mannose-6-phosphate isomerase-like protein (cupin superfamily)